MNADTRARINRLPQPWRDLVEDALTEARIAGRAYAAREAAYKRQPPPAAKGGG